MGTPFLVHQHHFTINRHLARLPSFPALAHCLLRHLKLTRHTEVKSGRSLLSLRRDVAHHFQAPQSLIEKQSLGRLARRPHLLHYTTLLLTRT